MSKNILKSLKEITEKNLRILRNSIVRAVIITLVVVLVICVSVYIVYLKDNSGGIKVLPATEVVQKTVNYINENILEGQGTVSLKGEVKEESGLYKFQLTFDYDGQKQDSEVYVTRDGRYLYPVMSGFPIDLDAGSNTSDNSNTSQITSCEEVQKVDKPVLEAFVVSQCPYGVQMQRVLAKAVESADIQDNLKVRYIGSISDDKITSMHGDDEAQENLRQICLREETDKYWDYVSCYMKKGETENCLNSTGVDKNALSACMSDSSRGLEYAKEDFALAEQYGVSDSPTLIMGDSQIDEFSFGGRTADAVKTIVCCAFNNQPSFCSQTLSQESAAVSFSETYSSGSNTNQDSGCE